jgi:hypothetical protein
MTGGSATAPPRKQRRSRRFPFDALVHLTTVPQVKKTGLWGRSIDLCREGIGLTVAAELMPDELFAVEIPLAADKPETVGAFVRYCNQGRCGFEFVNLDGRQREAIQAACEKLSKTGGHS